MLRLAVLGMCMLVVLAGCSKPGPNDPMTPAPTATQASSSDPSLPEVLDWTDTLHFLVAPHLTGHEPKSTRDTVIALPDAANFQAAPKWSFELPESLTQLAANLTLWVDVERSVAYNPGPTGTSCFWNVVLFVWAPDNGSAVADSACLPEEAVVANGVREIRLPIALASAVQAGSRVEVSVYTSALVVAPGASISLLTASVEHDSRFSVVGLRLPVDTLTLLQ